VSMICSTKSIENDDKRMLLILRSLKGNMHDKIFDKKMTKYFL
jgi:hypothetical protein